MVGRLITGPADLAEGAAWLAGQDPRFARALALVGDLPLRRKPDGFSALLEAIISQQVSVASANAIRARMAAAGYDSRVAVARAGEDDLRAAGLSRQKASYALALAHSAVDFDALRDLPDDRVIETLVAVKGIGRWTAEIYAIKARDREPLPAKAAGSAGLRRVGGIKHRIGQMRPQDIGNPQQIGAISAVAMHKDHHRTGFARHRGLAAKF